MKLTKKTALYIAALAVILVAIIVVLIVSGTKSAKPQAAPAVTPLPTPQVVIREKEVEVEKIVEVEKEITATTIRDGLRDMGFLVTEEYYFTQVVSFSSIKSLFKIELPFTESSYLAGYDGVVTAGIDFSKILVQKDDEARTITVTLPPAAIKNVDIDMDSFQLYSEKEGMWNRVSVEDFNQSLVELENNARNRALERGILDRADDNAVKVIDNFVHSLLAGTGYTVHYEYA